MDGPRVLAELERQLAARSTLGAVAGFVLLLAATSLLAIATGQGAGSALALPYLYAPVALCPIAAHRVLREREDGMAAVLATTPLTRTEALLAKTLAVLAIAPLAVVASLPLFYALTTATAPGAFLDLLVYPAWTLTVGTTAATTGLLVGHLTPARPRLGLGIAFGVVLFWLVAGWGLGQAPNPPRLVLVLLRRLSPLSYVAQGPTIGPLRLAPASLVLFPLTQAALAAAVLAPLALGLQHATGWSSPITRHPASLAAVILVLLVGTAALVPWAVPEAPDPPSGNRGYEGPSGELWMDIRLTRDFDGPGWGPDTPRTLRVNVVGPPNATLTIDRLELTSDPVDFRFTNETPETIVLDDVFRDRVGRWNATGGHAGEATFHVAVAATPRELFAIVPADVTLVIDGEAHRHQLWVAGTSWRTQPEPVLVASAATALPLAAAARWLPRWWNRW